MQRQKSLKSLVSVTVRERERERKRLLVAEEVMIWYGVRDGVLTKKKEGE